MWRAAITPIGSPCLTTVLWFGEVQHPATMRWTFTACPIPAALLLAVY